LPEVRGVVCSLANSPQLRTSSDPARRRLALLSQITHHGRGQKRRNVMASFTSFTAAAWKTTLLR
jgi:hypothetical protein